MSSRLSAQSGYAPWLTVLVYGYGCGATRSRRIARALDADIGLRDLSANQQPDFRTVPDFRKAHLAALAGLFVEVLRLCRAAGVAKLGRAALDGCMRAPARLTDTIDRRANPIDSL